MLGLERHGGIERVGGGARERSGAIHSGWTSEAGPSLIVIHIVTPHQRRSDGTEDSPSWAWQLLEDRSVLQQNMLNRDPPLKEASPACDVEFCMLKAEDERGSSSAAWAGNLCAHDPSHHYTRGSLVMQLCEHPTIDSAFEIDVDVQQP